MKDFIIKSLTTLFIFLLFIGFLLVNATDSTINLDGVKSHISFENIVSKVKGVFSEENVVIDESEKKLLDTSFDISKYPDNYVKINDGLVKLNKDDLKIIKKKGNKDHWIKYSRLDNKGRSREVRSLINFSSVYNHSTSVTERPQFDSSLKIAGEYSDSHFNILTRKWSGNVRNNKIEQLDNYRGYIYNKSHLLAWSLGGDMNAHNLILGTRAQNVGTNRANGDGGMGYVEGIIRNAVYNNRDLKVFYHAKPIYKDNEIIPRGVRVRAYSLNDKGNAVNIDVWIFNYQNGVTINYNTGTYQKV